MAGFPKSTAEPVKEHYDLTHTTDFLYLRESRGATVAFCKKGEGVSASIWTGKPITLGTYWCDFGVGVCFALDEKRCFFGHLKVEIIRDEPRVSVDHKRGQNIRDQVYDLLNAEANTMNWDHVNPHFAESAIVCCQNPEDRWHGEVYPRAGHYIILGIRDFLEDRADRLRYEAQAALERANKVAQMEGQSVDVLLRYMVAEHNDPESELDRDVLCDLQDDANKAKLYAKQAAIFKARANFPVQRKAHGFLAWPENGTCRVVKWIREAHEYSGNEELPQEIAKQYQKKEPVNEEGNDLVWWLSTKRMTRQIGKAKTAGDREHASLDIQYSTEEYSTEASKRSSGGEDSDRPLEMPLLRKDSEAGGGKGKGKA